MSKIKGRFIFPLDFYEKYKNLILQSFYDDPGFSLYGDPLIQNEKIYWDCIVFEKNHSICYKLESDCVWNHNSAFADVLVKENPTFYFKYKELSHNYSNDVDYLYDLYVGNYEITFRRLKSGKLRVYSSPDEETYELSDNNLIEHGIEKGYSGEDLYKFNEGRLPSVEMMSNLRRFQRVFESIRYDDGNFYFFESFDFFLEQLIFFLEDSEESEFFEGGICLSRFQNLKPLCKAFNDSMLKSVDYEDY